MYKIIESDQILLSEGGFNIHPFKAPYDRRTLSIQFETYEKAAEYIHELQKIGDFMRGGYHIVKI